MNRALPFVFVCVLGVILVACGSDARFDTKFASDYARGGTVSLFGVFKDGRMNAELSSQLAPTILRKGKCDPAYGADLVALKGPVASAVDDYIRQNGVTDALLAEFAPAAKGDTIMVISMSGHVGPRVGPTTTTTTTRQQLPGSTRQRGPTPMYESNLGTGEQSVFEMSASLYSVRLHKSVALLSMVYDGRDVDAAIVKFGDRLTQEMSLSSCAGWNNEMAPEEAKIKGLKEE